MTKVEELRKIIIRDRYWWFEEKVLDEVDSLIAAAKEEERNRIWNQGEAIMMGADGNPKFYIVSADNFIPLDEQTHDGRNR